MSQYWHKVSQKSPTLCPGYHLTIYSGAGKYFPDQPLVGLLLKGPMALIDGQLSCTD